MRRNSGLLELIAMAIKALTHKRRRATIALAATGLVMIYSVIVCALFGARYDRGIVRLA